MELFVREELSARESLMNNNTRVYQACRLAFKAVNVFLLSRKLWLENVPSGTLYNEDYHVWYGTCLVYEYKSYNGELIMSF